MTESPNQTRGEKAGWAVEIVDLNKWYGDFHVLRDINLTVSRGERIVICGPSGGGKSTMLRCVNRLEDWQRGRVIVDGKELTDDPKQILAVRRDVGMVFQQFNLFPHLTVLENCTLAPIWVRHMPKKEAEELAMRFLQRVRIPDQALKYPARFQLMFRPDKLDHDNAEFVRVANQSYRVLEDAIRAATGVSPDRPLSGEGQGLLVAIWAMVHGFSHLALGGELANPALGGGGKRVILQSLLPRTLRHLPLPPRT